MKVFVVLFAAIIAVNAGGHGGGKWYGPGSGVVQVSGDGAVIAGPSGKVSTSNHGHGDGLALGGWGGWAGHGVGLAGAGWAGAWDGGHGGWGGWGGAAGWGGRGWTGHGHEGQWIPDYNEKHFDDGSYRPDQHWGRGHH